MSGGDLSGADTLPGGIRTGEVLAGKYRLERLLGRGGMGEVYEARHVVVGRRFAVKFPHGSAALSAAAAARFLREAQAAGKLESPHLAAVLDFDRAPDGAPFLVMEYLEGESLARVLVRERKLAVPRVLDLLQQACAGLAVAHRAGIVHRDLKPDNLFIVTRGDGSELLKIVDFGIAKLLDDAAGGDVTQSGAVLGTPFYMAPEQARGERSVDLRVDVHALGVISYELLSGTKPHPGDSYNAILAHILTEPVEPLGRLCPGLPKALVAVIERAMAFDPATRHDSVDAFSRDLARFTAGDAKRSVDAGDVASPRPSRANVETVAGTNDDEAPGTLETAVGDVSTQRRTSQRRAGPWLLGVMAGVALYGLFGRSASRSPEAEPAPHFAENKAPPAAAPASVVGTAPAPAPPSIGAAASATVPSSSAAPATPKVNKRPALADARGGVVIPSASASASAAASPPVTFDEHNPY